MITAMLLISLQTSPLKTDVLREGHFLEVRGAFDAHGVFVAQEAVLLPPDDDVIIGMVAEAPHHRDRFFLHGQEVVVSDNTEWENASFDELKGMRVKVQGHWRGPRKFSAREISARDEGRDRLASRVDAIDRVPGGVRVRLMRWDVLLPEGLEIESATDPAALPLLPPRPVALQDEATDEDDLFGAGIELPYDLSFYAQFELESAFEENFDLDEQDAEDRADHALSARLRLLYEPSERFTAMGTGRLVGSYRDDEEDGTDSDLTARLGETWGAWHDVFLSDVDLVVGRQDFDDEREWLYDEDLDAVRVIVDKRAWRLDLSASTRLNQGSPRDESATNLFAYLSNGESRRHLAAYALYRDIEEPIEETPTHIGVRAIGDWLPANASWLEWSGLKGERNGQDLDAYGLDVGTTWTPAFLGPLSFTVGYAFGSGDADPSGTDHGYRQTGLQDNNDKFDGVTSFRYYGELFDPELANLSIVTAGIGARVAEKTSLDLVFHRYRQDEPLADLVDTGIDANPTGADGYLGTELDLIFGTRRFEDWDLELVAGWFRPGDGFSPDDDDAFLGKIQLRYRL